VPSASHEERAVELVRDRREDDAPRLADVRRQRLRRDALGARLEAQLALAVDVAEGEGRRHLALQRVERDAEPCATVRESLALVGADARHERGARAETRGGGGRIDRGAPDAPLGIARELVARRVPDRDEVVHA